MKRLGRLTAFVLALFLLVMIGIIPEKVDFGRGWDLRALAQESNDQASEEEVGLFCQRLEAAVDVLLASKLTAIKSIDFYIVEEWFNEIALISLYDERDGKLIWSVERYRLKVSQIKKIADDAAFVVYYHFARTIL